jgi:hypothetical protein
MDWFWGIVAITVSKEEAQMCQKGKGKNALKLEVKLNMCISFKYSKFLNLGPLSAVFH